MTDFRIALRGTLESTSDQEEIIASLQEALDGTRDDVLMTPAKTASVLSQLPSSTAMQPAVYDPNNIQGDVFDRANHVGLIAAGDITGLAPIAITAEYADLLNAPVLATVALSGSYLDLSDKPALGTAAATNIGEYATAEQGAKADTALQGLQQGTNIVIDFSDPLNPVINSTGGGEGAAGVEYIIEGQGITVGAPIDTPTVSLSPGSLASLALADTSLQPEDIGDTVQGYSAVLQATTAPYTTTLNAKLGGIAEGATANSTDAQLRDRSTHTGTQSADTLTDGTVNVAYLAVERTKLAGIATGATANSTDAQLRDRSTHTGTQAATTITGLATVATSGSYADLTDKPGTASAAEYLANSPAGELLTNSEVWNAAAPVAGGNVSGTLTFDFSAFINRTHTMTGAVTLGAISNLKPGQTGILYFNQDATGGRTLSVSTTYWALPGGTLPSIVTTANAKNRLAYSYEPDGRALLTLIASGVA